MSDEAQRNLTDADAKAIAREVRNLVVEEFYQDIGKGVWGVIWRTIVAGLLLLAAWGAVKDTPPPFS